MTAKKDYSKIASILVGGTPIDYSLKEDGSLVVIAPTGQKFRFSSDQVASASPAPNPKPKTTSQPRRGRPPNSSKTTKSYEKA